MQAVKTPAVPMFKVLVWLVAVHIATTILHYADNVLFFGEYPEPTWLGRGVVDMFWFVMTPFALVGLWLARCGRSMQAVMALLAYAGMSLLALGHYRYAAFCSISLQIHTFIMLEALVAVALIFLVIRYGARFVTAAAPYEVLGRMV